MRPARDRHVVVIREFAQDETTSSRILEVLAVGTDGQNDRMLGRVDSLAGLCRLLEGWLRSIDDDSTQPGPVETQA